MRELVIGVLLGAGVAAELACCVGVASARTTLARVHYAAAGSTVGPLLVAVAVAVERKLSSDTATAVLVTLLLFVLGTVAAHAIGAAAYARRR